MAQVTEKMGNGVPGPDDLALINRFAHRELEAEEVFVFPLVLCDNEVDRDYDCFTREALAKLAELFVGKTGIFDHDPKGGNQTARIYKAAVEADPARKTSQGEPYACLKAHAYMVRAEKNRDLILEIEAGIKKEVSVGCTVEKIRCSVCGSDMQKSPCDHRKGNRYPGASGELRLCYHLLENPTDAYEWSFVAVPAQIEAGVTKVWGGQAPGEYSSAQAILRYVKGERKALTLKGGQLRGLQQALTFLEQEAEEGRKAAAQLRKETARLYGLTHPELAGALSRQMVEALSPQELGQLKETLEKQLAKRYPYTPQTLAEESHKQKTDGLGDFRI